MGVEALSRWRGRAWVVGGAGVVTWGLLLVLAWPAPATAAGVRRDDSTRYYVVPAAVNGQRDYLYQISVRTLGDGNRHREIFELNKNRAQPDGQQWTDPTDLRPGWILLLPADAAGPEVRVGPIPTLSVTSPDDGLGDIGVSLLALGLSTVAAVTVVMLLKRRKTRHGSRARAAEGSPDEAALTLDLFDDVGRDGDDGHDGDEVAGPPEAAEPPPASVVDGDPVEVLSGDGSRWAVRLVDHSRDGTRAPYAWLRPDVRLDGAAMPVDLGCAGPLRLWVDLARAPDVLTISGSLPVCRRQAAAIVDQLTGHDTEIIVVGDVLGPATGATVRRVAAFPDAQELAASGHCLVISGGLQRAELRTVRWLARQPDRRIAVVIVGTAVRGRWSMAALGGSEPVGP
jgi:hypothetical protein